MRSRSSVSSGSKAKRKPNIEKKVFRIAELFELGLVFEGKYAKEFFRNEKKSVVSKRLAGICKRATKVHEKVRELRVSPSIQELKIARLAVDSRFHESDI